MGLRTREKLANIKMIAFDMYGTLVRNDQSSWQSLTEDLVEDFALPVNALKLHELWSMQERKFRERRLNYKTLKLNPPFVSYKSAWGIAWDKAFKDSGIEADSSIFAQRGIERMGLRESFDDSTFVLNQMSEKIRLGVLSNADDQYLSASLIKHGWKFELTLSSESARTYKPDPEIFRLFCQKAGLGPNEVLFVGDSLYDDIHGAKNAGLSAIQILRNQDTPGRTPIPEGVEMIPPDSVITSLTELLDLIP